MLDTPCIKEDEAKMLETLKHIALYIILSPYDSEQSDLIHRVMEEKALNKIPKYKGLLEEFTNLELIAQKEFSKVSFTSVILPLVKNHFYLLIAITVEYQAL